MKNNLIAAGLILLMFLLPMATSLLLEIELIEKNAARKILIYVLMLVEFVVIIIVLLQFLKDNVNQ